MVFLLESALSNAVIATGLALVAAIVARLSRQPVVAYGLWFLVLLKLVTPPLVSLPVAPGFSSGVQPNDTAHRAARVSPVSDAALVPHRDAGVAVTPATDGPRFGGAASPPRHPDHEAESSLNAAPPAFEDTEPAEVLANATLVDNPVEHHSDQAAEPVQTSHLLASTVAASPPAGASRLWGLTIASIWLAGTSLSLLRSGIRIVAFRRLLLECGEGAPRRLQECARRLASHLGLRRCPRIAVVSGVVSPMLWAGARRPTILLPRALLKDLSDEQLETLLAHELAHLRRKDHLVRFLELAVTALYWWHPVAWWARRRLREAEEQACDAWVVSTLPAAAETYATALLRTAEFLSRARPALPPAGSGAGHFSSLKRRLTMILTGTTHQGASIPCKLAIVAFAALLLPLSLTGAPTEPEGKGESETLERPASVRPEGSGNNGSRDVFADFEDNVKGVVDAVDELDEDAGESGNTAREERGHVGGANEREHEHEHEREHDSYTQGHAGFQDVLLRIGRLLVAGRRDEAERLARSVRRRDVDPRQGASRERYRRDRDGDRRARSRHDAERAPRRKEGVAELDDVGLFGNKAKDEIVELVEELEARVHEAVDGARGDIKDAVSDAPKEVREVLRGLNLEKTVEEALQRAPDLVREVLEEVEVEKTTRDALRRFRDEAAVLEEHLREELNDDVKSELRKAFDEAREEIQSGVHEARKEIERSLHKAPREVREALRDLDVDDLIEDAIRTAPHIVKDVIREIDVESATRDILREIADESMELHHDETAEPMGRTERRRVEEPESRRDPARTPRGETRKLQRRIEELESAISTLLTEIESLRREIESRN